MSSEMKIHVLGWVTNSSGSDVKIFKRVIFRNETTSEMK